MKMLLHSMRSERDVRGTQYGSGLGSSGKIVGEILKVHRYQRIYNKITIALAKGLNDIE